ncbi:MAG TPA: hypothetical protein VH877_21875 [Polyangia bacterium]|jgi:hypothetical protein|nr:hypothetical protein [Polyangia bacterium]
MTVALLGLAGCKKDKMPKDFCDEASGPDATRAGAVLIQSNGSATDRVSCPDRDRTDWKQIELKGQPSIFEVEVHWDNAESDISCDVFDSFGQQIGASPGPAPQQQSKRLAVEIPSAGVYFLRIQAPKKTDASDYVLTTKWGGEVQAPPPEVKQPEPKPVKKPVKTVSKPKSFDPEKGLQGRVVSVDHQGDALILYIDKGSAAGVKVGNTGTVLDGPAGANPLSGGTFSVIQVLDEKRSVAKTGLKSIGRNIRVSINTGAK